MRHWILRLLALLLPAMGATADTTGISVVMILPGFPGTTAAAQPYVDKMLRVLETRMHQPAGSMSGTFTTDGGRADALFSQMRPQLALLGPSVYAQHAGKTPMKVIATLRIRDRGDGRYALVTRTDGPAALSALAGASIAAVGVDDPRFVANVLLDGAVRPDAITVTRAKTPLRALRAVAASKVVAAVVDAPTAAQLSTLPFGSELRVLHRSAPVSPPVVAVLGAQRKHAAQWKSVLTALCRGPEGTSLCASFLIESIDPANDKAVSGLLKRYRR